MQYQANPPMANSSRLPDWREVNQRLRIAPLPLWYLRKKAVPAHRPRRIIFMKQTIGYFIVLTATMWGQAVSPTINQTPTRQFGQPSLAIPLASQK